MSDVVTLSRRGTAEGPLEVEGVTADRIAGLGEREIASLPVRVGSRAAKLGDFFDVRGGRAARVRIDGDVAQVHGIGAGMAGGELVIDGDYWSPSISAWRAFLAEHRKRRSMLEMHSPHIHM